MTTDYITDFMEIKNFDASLVINPDSIYIKQMSSYVFETYITSKIGFKMLTGKQYFAKAFSPITDKNILRIKVNSEDVVVYPANNYPLFSFDTSIIFKNAETVEYSRAVCSTDETDSEDITVSSNFSIYDIRYILMNDANFLTSISNLGYDGPFTLPTTCLSMPASDLLNLVARREWKFRIRYNNKSFYTQVFDGNDFYKSAKTTAPLLSGINRITGLNTWIEETIAIC